MDILQHLILCQRSLGGERQPSIHHLCLHQHLLKTRNQYSLTIDELVVLSSLTDSCHPLLLNSVGITIRTKLGLVVDEHIHIYINNYRLPWQSCPFTSSGYQALSSCGLARRLIYTIQVYNWYTLYH